MPTPTEENTRMLIALNEQVRQCLEQNSRTAAMLDQLWDENLRLKTESSLLTVKVNHLETTITTLRTDHKSLEAQLNSLTANQAAMAAKVDADKDQIQQLWRWVYWLVTLIVATIVGILVKVVWR
jgi:chromosome segregation ATPase